MQGIVYNYNKNHFYKGLTSKKTNINTCSSYRFGFNGQEKDNEVYGERNSYDFEERIYNSRLGRFLSIDGLTKKYPMLTPYQFASNTPIMAIDLDGLEGLITIYMDKAPVGFNKLEFAESLQRRLIENGAHPNTKVVYAGTKEYEEIDKSQYKDNQSADLFIRDYMPLKDYEHPDAGGYSELSSHQSIVFRGLNADNPNAKQKTWKYVNAALHELGHSIYGFDHDAKGNTTTGVGIMDYNHAYEENAKFSPDEQSIIRQRSGIAKEIKSNINGASTAATKQNKNYIPNGNSTKALAAAAQIRKSKSNKD